jgi:S-layer homology domain
VLAGQSNSLNFPIANAYQPSNAGVMEAVIVKIAEPCTASFPDVPPDNTFYEAVRCLVCRGVISGYPDGTFRPNSPVTRGQIAKLVALAAGFNEPTGAQTYEDVPPGSPYFEPVQRLTAHRAIGGYPCGQRLEEPCRPPTNLPYFRPNEGANRGQMSKIVCEAAGFNDPPTTQTFQDVPTSHPFYVWVERMVSWDVVTGYTCGQRPEEPCVPPLNRPYFRPGSDVSRGQSAKIVANTFFPGCAPSQGP